MAVFMGPAELAYSEAAGERFLSSLDIKEVGWRNVSNPSAPVSSVVVRAPMSGGEGGPGQNVPSLTPWCVRFRRVRAAEARLSVRLPHHRDVGLLSFLSIQSLC